MNKDDYLKLFEEAQKKREERVKFLDDLAPKEITSIDELNTAELIGVFVVHEQLLEENIKLLLNTIYGFKSAASNGKFLIMRNDEFNGLTLGDLHKKLTGILFHEAVAPQKQVDLLESLKSKLNKFKVTRNDYIHRLLQQSLEVNEFKKKILEAIIELGELARETNKARIKVDKHYDFDGNSFLSLAGHMISKDATKKG